jgi:nucleoside-diphosphate-sugar epimerase
VGKRIFLTGSTGCIGQYLTEQLIRETDHELFLLARNPSKFQIDLQARHGVQVLPGDMLQIGDYADLLKTMDVAILTAAAWGDPALTEAVNYSRTLELLDTLDPDRLEQAFYFSTASILNYSRQLLPEAEQFGTDYIATKARCLKAIEDRAIAPKVTAIFPTLVFGGDASHPYSHLTGSIQDVIKWIGLARWFQVDASFHFAHAYDIAQVVRWLVDHPQPQTDGLRKVVVGNPAQTVNQTVTEICDYYGKWQPPRAPLYAWLAEFFIKVFNIEVAEWDRFCIRYRHFVHDQVVNPRSLGLVPYAATIADLLKVSGC